MKGLIWGSILFAPIVLAQYIGPTSVSPWRTTSQIGIIVTGSGTGTTNEDGSVTINITGASGDVTNEVERVSILNTNEANRISQLLSNEVTRVSILNTDEVTRAVANINALNLDELNVTNFYTKITNSVGGTDGDGKFQSATGAQINYALTNAGYSLGGVMAEELGAATNTGNYITASALLTTASVATNSPSDGQILSATGNERKWIDAAAGSGSSNIIDSAYTAVIHNIQLSTNMDVIRPGIGTTITPVVTLTNSTDAAAGAQQASPALMFGGNGWKTATTAGSQPVRIGLYALPAQLSTAPDVHLGVISSINNAAITDTGTYFDGSGNLVLGSKSLTIGGTLTPQGKVAFNNPSSTIILSGDVNDWAPSSTASVVRMTNSTLGNVNITGYASQAGSQGARVVLYNLSTNTAATITLKHDSESSSAANRLCLPNNADIVLQCNSCIEIMCMSDGNIYRWRCIR